MSFIEDLRSISETNEDSIFGLIESKIYTHAKLVAQSVEDNIKQMVRKGDCERLGKDLVVNIGPYLPRFYYEMEIVDQRDKDNYMLMTRMNTADRENCGIMKTVNCHDYDSYSLTFFNFIAKTNKYSKFWDTRFFTDYIFDNNSYIYSRRYKKTYIDALRNILEKDSVILDIYLRIIDNGTTVASYKITDSNPDINLKFMKMQRELKYGMIFNMVVRL